MTNTSTPETSYSQLVAHAQRELEKAGLFDEDSDYDGMLGKAVMEMIKIFDGQGHSGMSASMCIDIASRLMRFENLTPLTDDPDEWMDVTYTDEGTCHQSRRRANAFSEDGGKTYYLLSDEPRKLYASKSHIKVDDD